MALNFLFYPNNNPNPQNIQFTITYNVALEELENRLFGFFRFKNDESIISMSWAVCYILGRKTGFLIDHLHIDELMFKGIGQCVWKGSVLPNWKSWIWLHRPSSFQADLAANTSPPTPMWYFPTPSLIPKRQPGSKFVRLSQAYCTFCLSPSRTKLATPKEKQCCLLEPNRAKGGNLKNIIITWGEMSLAW